MKIQDVDIMPRTWTRVAGALYLIIIAIGTFGEAFVRSKLVVPGDPASTAAKIKASELLWRASIAGEFIMLISATVLAVLFYALLRPVHRDLALLGTLFNVVSIALDASNKLNLLAALFPLGKAEYLRALDPNQLHAMTYFSTRSHTYGFGISLIFFACECLILGYLIYKSGYLPKAVGILMSTAGACYLVNSFSLILSPSFAGHLYPFILLPAFVGETSLCLWLLFKGVNVAGWNAQAALAGSR